MESVQRLAAIDIGTNSVRLVVAEPLPDGSYAVLDEERAMTRLGRGLSASGRLSDDAFAMSLEALGRMKAIAEGREAKLVRVVATSAVREASNGAEFRKAVWRTHRLRVEVISPEEEAQYALLSASRRFPIEGRSLAVADLGGGSLEVVLAAGSVVDRVISLDLGAVRLTDMFCLSDPLKERDWRRLRRHIDHALKRDLGKLPFPVEVLIGSGGSFSALGAMARFERDGREGTSHGTQLTRAEAARLLARMLELPLEMRRQMPGLPPGRADIMIAGAAVVTRLARYLGVRQLVVNEGGVRDGLILSAIGGSRGVGPVEGRMEGVRDFARRCRSNVRHCEHVADLAGRLFDGMRRRADLPASARELLTAAARLHDVGFLVSHEKHHKHAFHLIMHSDLPGFSAREVEVIANVVRYHRRALPSRDHTAFARLQKADRRLVKGLAGLLRVAVALNRTHAQLVTDVRLRRRGDRTTIEIVAEQEPEVELWDARRKAALFGDAFKTDVAVRWRRPAPQLRLVASVRRAGGAA